MIKSAGPIACLCAALVLAACNPGPSDPGSDKDDVLERKIEFLEGLAGRRDLAARVWSEIAKAVPDRLWPTEVVYKDGEVEVKGSALSYDRLADFISRLEESPGLSKVDLRTSVQKTGRTGDYYEFTIAARVGVGGEAGPSGASAVTEARLAELKEILTARPAPADGLRDLQRLAADSGLRMTKCVFGQATSGEFATELPVAVEVEGSRGELGRYLGGLAGLPHFRFVKELRVKAVDARDARSAVRASIAASAYFPK
jgi:hypothetical protein